MTFLTGITKVVPGLYVADLPGSWFARWWRLERSLGWGWEIVGARGEDGPEGRGGSYRGAKEAIVAAFDEVVV